MKKIAAMMVVSITLVSCSTEPEVPDLTYGTDGWDLCASEIMSRMESADTIEDDSIELQVEGIQQVGNQVTGYVTYQSNLDAIFGDESTYKYTCTVEDDKVLETDLSSANSAK